MTSPIFIKILTTVFLILCISASHAKEAVSKEYTTAEVRENGVDYLVVLKDGKKIYGIGSGYGGFDFATWSEDQKYLAVVDHGTKQSGELQVYSVSGDNVEQIELPDFRLNILGRYGKINGGWHTGLEKLEWKTYAGELILCAHVYGSLVKSVDLTSLDDPHSFYRFKVEMSVDQNNRVELHKITNLNKEKPRKDVPGKYVTMVYIAADGDKVWQALVDTELSKQYHFYPITKIDLKKGGEIVFGNGVIEGEIIDFEKGKTLSYTYRAKEYHDEEQSEVHINLSSSGGVSMIHLTHEVSDVSSVTHNNAEWDWPLILSGLKTFSETGKELKRFK